MCTNFFCIKIVSAQFSVTYRNTYKLVHNLALDEYYVLYCTKAQPNVGSDFQSKTFIQIPVKSFAAVDTRVLGYLDVSFFFALFLCYFFYKPQIYQIRILNIVTCSKR
jgi:hypothetical protein